MPSRPQCEGDLAWYLVRQECLTYNIGMFGILNVNKPSGCTSRDVVNQIQRLLRGMGYGRKFKLGHAGTLDPLADGVLVVCLGPATKLITYVQQMPKRYEATFLLGRRSDSFDTETEIELLEDTPRPTLAELEQQLPKFLGPIEQVPPTYSAVKIGGQRAYDLARQGVDVEVKPRTVEIYKLKIADYDFPELRMSIECGSGTYVRSLGRDLAATCGSDAVMSALTRTAIGSFELADAVSADKLTEETLGEQLRPARMGVAALPQVTLAEVDLDHVRHGRRIRPPNESLPVGDVAAVDDSGELVAVMLNHAGWLSPKNVFLAVD